MDNLEAIKIDLWEEYIEEHPSFTGCLIDKDKDIFWFKNGLLHREDGPAVEWADGSKNWHKHGKYHREDGPAVEWANGYKEWWLNGIRYESEQKWKIATRRMKWLIWNL